MNKNPFKHLSQNTAEKIATVALQRERRSVEERKKGPTPLTLESLDKPHTPEEAELYDLVHGLSPDQLIELTALLWLGRGDGDETADMWDELIENATDQATTITEDCEYVLSKAPLGEYIANGLKKLANEAA